MKNYNYKYLPSLLKIILLLVISSLITSCNYKRLDATEVVADKFLRASVENDLADLQETLDPACVDIADTILLQIGLSALVGGAEFEYVELEVQTLDKGDSWATVHAEGKLQGIILGTQVIVPINTDIPLVKKDGKWYVTCNNGINAVRSEDLEQQSEVIQIPGEQIIDNWRFVILDTADLETYGYLGAEPSEGYKLFGIHLSVENMGNEVAELMIGGFGTFVCEDDRGFTYDLVSQFSGEGPSIFPIYALNPPKFRVHGWLACEVPISASMNYLVIKTGISEIRFDLENIDHAKLNFPSDTITLMSFGESLTQEGVLTIKPLRALLYSSDTYTNKWMLFVEVLVENLYGYEYGVNDLKMQIYDSSGQINQVTDNQFLYPWPDSITEKNGNIERIPPGLKDSGFISSLIGETTTDWTEQPTGLKLLIYMPKPNGLADTTTVFGLYELSNLITIN